MSELRIGAKIWKFDENRRIYPPAPKGRLWHQGGPIYREHWREVEIKAENRRSWITAYGKAPKSGDHRGWAFSAAEVDADCWVEHHRYKVERLLERCRDPFLIQRVAEVLGYKAEEPRSEVKRGDKE